MVYYGDRVSFKLSKPVIVLYDDDADMEAKVKKSAFSHCMAIGGGAEAGKNLEARN